MRIWAVAVLAALAGTGCGYHVAGHADLMPKSIKTIAVTPFFNATPQYKVAERITNQIGREFISRTRYRVVPDPNQADAVLTGGVSNVAAYPTVADPVTGRSTGVQILVWLQVTLTDRATGAVLFSRPSLEFRERYEISTDTKAYFDESGTSIERLSRDVARTVVSAILEDF